MTNPYRAMCAELVNDLEEYGEAVVDAGVGWVDPDTRELLIRARALLDQPVAEGPTDEELWELYDDKLGQFGFAEDWPWIRNYVRAVLALLDQPTPQPVAVGERLPGPEDCLDEGWAWFFNKRIGWRQAVLPVSPGYTHWLPANALPTPEATND